jgi:inorganic pyrophosphatase
MLGVIEAEQKEKGEPKKRNDRFVFVPVCSHEHENFQSLKDLPKEKIEDLEGFFKYYNSMEGKKFEIVGMKGPKKAMALLKKQIL